MADTPDDVAGRIWAKCAEGRTFETAEARAELDIALRAELEAIEDRSLRFHAREIIRDRRVGLFTPYAPPRLRRHIESLERRLAMCERRLAQLAGRG